MKKKIVTSCLVVALLVVGIVGASLAYFTDKDAKTNVFTVGKVNITLNEKFDENNAKLLPGSSKNNAIQKEVTITNDKSSQEAYVWYEWLIPAALDSTDGSTGTHNVVHVNSPGRTWDKYRENKAYWADGQTEALPLEKTWDHTLEGTVQGFVGTETVEGIVYNKYVTLYHGKLAAGETTTVGMHQVYLDSKVDTNDDGTGYVLKTVENGETVVTPIKYDFSKGVNIIVRAYGIQANGFTDVYAAYNAYYAQNK